MICVPAAYCNHCFLSSKGLAFLSLQPEQGISLFLLQQGVTVSSLCHLQTGAQEFHETVGSALQVEVAAEGLQGCRLQVFFQ